MQPKTMSLLPNASTRTTVPVLANGRSAPILFFENPDLPQNNNIIDFFVCSA